LPLVKLGNEVLNGQERQLKAFRDLTGSDSAFLMIHDNKVIAWPPAQGQGWQADERRAPAR
jgi:hypothetical protein